MKGGYECIHGESIRTLIANFVITPHARKPELQQRFDAGGYRSEEAKVEIVDGSVDINDFRVFVGVKDEDGMKLEEWDSGLAEEKPRVGRKRTLGFHVEVPRLRRRTGAPSPYGDRKPSREAILRVEDEVPANETVEVSRLPSPVCRHVAVLE